MFPYCQKLIIFQRTTLNTCTCNITSFKHVFQMHSVSGTYWTFSFFFVDEETFSVTGHIFKLNIKVKVIAEKNE